MRTRLIKYLNILAGALSLSGCVAYDSLNAMNEEWKRKEETARFETARLACDRYGFRVGTDAFAQCLQTEINQIKNREAIAEAAKKTSAAAEEAGKAKPMTCRKDMIGQVKCTPDGL